MKLNIFYLDEDACLTPDQLSEKLANFPRYRLTNESWPEIPTNCGADFTIAHVGQQILINFKVVNDYFGAIHRPVNSEVHLDNCVEFFIAFDEADPYYNIEFNCLGVGKVAYGSQKINRTLLPELVVRKIRTYIKSEDQKGVFNWEIMLSIPADVFVFHQIKNFEGMTARANFYKCGDALPHPHYLCWNKIVAPFPDFHRPDYFGTIEFMTSKVETNAF